MSIKKIKQESVRVVTRDEVVYTGLVAPDWYTAPLMIGDVACVEVFSKQSPDEVYWVLPVANIISIHVTREFEE